ncbi:MAG TPA: hypothetical protein VJS44_13820 [Pyrinomonadaceae bacterium]|nr:hypothetical protein [Pyrinomonadaceae bacterium]
MLRNINPYRFVRKALPLLAACFCLLALAASVPAQKSGKDEAPCFSEYRGVQIGMKIDDARLKLGKPKEMADELDIYNFSEKESAQVYYDKTSQKITAISVDYVGATEAPECRKVTGTEADSKADGSKFKLVRYPKAGYWVSYNRTAGATPIVTVTMQKIQ